MNTVERVKRISKQKKTPIYRMEKDLVFGNGYIGQLRKGEIPATRLAMIADYYELPMEYVLGLTLESQLDDVEYEIKQFTHILDTEKDANKREQAAADLDSALARLAQLKKQQKEAPDPQQGDGRDVDVSSYYNAIKDLCGDDLEKLKRLQDALSKEPEKTKASFDLFLKTL